MKPDQIKILLNKLGSNKIQVGGNGWVRGTCPFARWFHKNGVDSRPSFGISIDPDDSSSYKCFTCSETGNLSNLMERFREVTRERNQPYPYSTEIESFILTHNVADAKLMLDRLLAGTGAWKEKKKSVQGLSMTPQDSAALEEKLPDPLPDSELDKFERPSGEALLYLRETRRLSLETIELFELRWHPGSRRIAIPIRDRNRRLMGISGRAIDKETKLKFLHSKGFRRDFLFYGEHLCQGNEIAHLVEGFFDVHRLRELGYRNPIAMMGTYLSDFQQRALRDRFRSLVVVPDGDKAGVEGAVRIQKQLLAALPVSIADMPTGMDPDDLTPESAKEILGDP